MKTCFRFFFFHRDLVHGKITGLQEDIINVSNSTLKLSVRAVINYQVLSLRYFREKNEGIKLRKTHQANSTITAVQTKII